MNHPLARAVMQWWSAAAIAAAWVVPIPLATAQGLAPASLVLEPSRSSGTRVGEAVRWTVRSAHPLGEHTRYRFRIARSAGPLRMVRDFSPANGLLWAPAEEGQYLVEATTHDLATGASSTIQQTHEVVSPLTSSNAPVLASTEHPLVFIYTAPPQPSGLVRARFRATPDGSWVYTHWRPFNGASVSFHIVGMLPRTRYEVQHEASTPAGHSFGPVLTRTTKGGLLPLPEFSPILGPDPIGGHSEPVLLHSLLGVIPRPPIATDLSGRVLWYHRFPPDDDRPISLSYLLRPVPATPDRPGGSFLMFHGTSGKYSQLLREIDYVGHVIRETNVDEVNRQLAALGESPVACFSHEAFRSPDGATFLLASQARPGPGGKSTRIGDVVIALDREWQVSWTWYSFDHLDPNRPAVLGEPWQLPSICNAQAVSRLSEDWTHANSIEYSPGDGNLVLSLRHQDWVIKVDYRDGQGTGQVLWRLGADGDFSVVADPGEPYPWFSHQHDARLHGDILTLFDNGNTRCRRTSGSCNSRGQVWHLDEGARQATLVTNADLGAYAPAFGSAQRLENGYYHFLAGTLHPGAGHSLQLGTALNRSIEVLSESGGWPAAGSITSVLEGNSMAYRSFRLPNLYMSR